MARSEQEIAKAIADSDAWMDAVKPARLAADAVNDRRDLRQIGVAMLAIEAAEQSLVAAVAQAKAGGRSWTDIANVLGVSRQAARQRFDARLESARPVVPALPNQAAS
ncbi:MAG: sigma-70 family RNA polymerase sigma factor [Jatrophihabitantaceae bacterium]